MIIENGRDVGWGLGVANAWCQRESVCVCVREREKEKVEEGRHLNNRRLFSPCHTASPPALSPALAQAEDEQEMEVGVEVEIMGMEVDR